jgi:two-component system sensor histidine kinase KdpD
VDELAHTNAPGSRHAKRWQDVEELLAAGIDVSTTLNVQHVDGLNDVVAQITGITVRETVPDSIVDRADEIELIDLPPDDLLQRLREGRVYVPAQAETAIRNFFRKGNLIALRELALRRTAERVDAEMESYRRDTGIATPWTVRDRLLVCVGDPDAGLKLVRSARRMAAALKAQWIVAHVETPAELRWPQSRRDYIVDVMGFASDLGAETVMLQGVRVADEILALAKARNVSRILVGKPSAPRWRRWIEGSLAQTLVDGGRDMDVYLVSGETEGEGPERVARGGTAVRLAHHLQAMAVVLAGTALAFVMFPYFALANLVMVYLLAVMVAALWLGRGPGITASVLSVAAFDFFFVPPRFTFAVSDTQYLVTFGVMLATSLTVSTMAHWLRVQAHAANSRERRTATLFRLSGELAAVRTSDELLATAVRMIGEEFDGRAALLLPDEAGRVALRAGHLGTPHHERHEIAVAQWVFDNGTMAGKGTTTLPASDGLYLPLRGSTGVIGVLGLVTNRPGDVLRPDQMRFLETMANQVALAIERGRHAEQAGRTQVEIESERLKNTMLSSISHDLRTPLAVITGAAGSLLEREQLDPAMRRELAATIVEESRRLSRQVSNLLDMTRLESGAVQPRMEWHSLEEVVGVALARLSPSLEGREVRVDVASVPLVPLDDVLIGQVFVNLVDNALHHTPPGTPIEIRAVREERSVRLEVADHGPGLPPGTETKVFEKFFRGPSGAARGVGLGLAICRGFVEAHGGRIEAANLPSGGTVIRFWLPIESEPPLVEPEPAHGEPSAQGAPPAPGTDPAGSPGGTP